MQLNVFLHSVFVVQCVLSRFDIVVSTLNTCTNWLVLICCCLKSFTSMSTIICLHYSLV